MSTSFLTLATLPFYQAETEADGPEAHASKPADARHTKKIVKKMRGERKVIRSGQTQYAATLCSVGEKAIERRGVTPSAA